VIGLYYFIVGAAALPAPLVAGWLWQWDPTLPFLVGGAVSTIGFLLFLWVRSVGEPVDS
jgi:hypothetical protein